MTKKRKKLRRRPVPVEEIGTEKAAAELQKPQRPPAQNLLELVTPPTKRTQSTDRLHLIRYQAMIDYVTDPDCRTARWHYERADRRYARYASFESFKTWSCEEGWVARRDQFWEKISTRMLDDEQERLLQEQKEEADQLRFIRRHLVEHLMPVLDDDGEVKRHPELDGDGEPHPLAGKPILPYRITSYDKALKAFLEVDERLMLKRGEVTTRTETASNAEDTGGASPLDPATQTVKFTPDQLRAMSRAVLRQAQPELAQPLAIDADDEADQDGDDESI